MNFNKRLIKVKHVAFSDINGGAARAAYRVHNSLLKNRTQLNIISEMRVIRKYSNDRTVKGGYPSGNLIKFQYQRILNKFSRIICLNQSNKVISTAWPSSGLSKELNYQYKNRAFDLINLHWLGDLTLSIKEIGKLKMPLTWRLADQWAFCGCEHYSELEESNKNNNNIEVFEVGYGSSFDKFLRFNFNNYSWNLKRKYWKNPINIIAPTNWIADCARRSLIFKNSFISVIPTPIDSSKWSPVELREARSILNLPFQKKILLFGALGGMHDRRKGGDLLIKTLNLMQSNKFENIFNSYELVIIGDKGSDFQIPKNIKSHFIGRINDDNLLKYYYSAADIFILPSRKDNLPGTGIESFSCGTPVIAFNVGGLADIIENGEDGFLIEPFDCYEMALKLKLLISNENKLKDMGYKARKKAIRLWSEERISKLYNEHYLNILENKLRTK